eukprot:gene14639-16158_t
MESLSNVLNVITPNAWMASVDLKDAFYSIPINPNHQKYFKFVWGGKFYQFLGMPNGYGPAMRVFTKILKPPFSFLRQNGHIPVVFVDDTYLQGHSFQECHMNVTETIRVLRSLGFTIHFEKSIFIPTQKITFLGFVLNSQSMTISLSADKAESIRKQISSLLSSEKITIRDLASITGKIVATFPAFLHAKLHYRALENQNIQELRYNTGNFESYITLSACARQNLEHWERNIEYSGRPIKTPSIDLTLYTDASHKGWGATDGTTPTGGRWHEEDLDHINVLELKAIKFAILAFCRGKQFQHIRIMSDNTTAIAYINNMGGTKSKTCNILAQEIWQICISQNSWLSAAHIPGNINTTADLMSRVFNDNTEWKLCSKNVEKIVSMIGRTASKIIEDKSEGIIIIPEWNTQYWMPIIMRLMVNRPIQFCSSRSMLKLPFNKEKIHPLYPKLNLLAVHVSAKSLKNTNFQKTLHPSSWIPGSQEQRKDISQHGTNGSHFVLHGERVNRIQITHRTGKYSVNFQVISMFHLPVISGLRDAGVFSRKAGHHGGFLSLKIWSLKSFMVVSAIIVPVTNADLDYAYSHLVEASDNNSDYEEHFQYVIDELQLTAANDWKTGLDLYKTITNVAVNGI